MDSKEKLSKGLNRFWENTNMKSSAYLAAKSTENDGPEILAYLSAIVESAFEQNRIDGPQQSLCKANLSRISILLPTVKAVPTFKKALLGQSPDQLLQSLLTFSDADVKNMMELINQSEESYIELNATSGSNTIYFLYQQLNNNAVYYDRYVQRTLPVNGDAEFCCYDNYFPLYKLMEKYFPHTSIRLISNAKQAQGKYVYVIAFKRFPGFAAKKADNLLSVIPRHILQDCSNGKAIIVYNDLAESTFYPPIIDNFERQLKSAGLLNSFFLLSGDWANEVLKKNNSSLQKIRSVFMGSEKRPYLYIANFFEEAMAYSKRAHYPDYGFGTKLNCIKSNLNNLRYFICLNRTVKDYRLYLSYFFFANNLMDKVFISQDKYTGLNDFQFGYNQNPALLSSMPGPKFEKFKQSLPWHIDYTNMKNYMWDDVPVEALNNSFCWVVTETSFGETLPGLSLRLTEKTYKPIAFFMPFIMVGNPFILKKLHHSGYQTFAQWWDESYDDIIDPIERMKVITDVILKISRLNRRQLMDMYEEMKPVLLHNYEILMQSKSTEKAIRGIYNACLIT